MYQKIKKRAKNRRGIFSKGKKNGLKKTSKLLEIISKRASKLKSGANAVTDAKLQEWKTALENLAEGEGKDDSREQKAKDKLGACLKTVVESRIKTWCTACGATNAAAIAEIWDDTNSKIKVHENTCRSIVAECATAIAFIKRIKQVDIIARQIRKALKGRSDKAPADQEPEPVSEQTADTECGDDENACKENSTKRQNFCQKISLNKDDKKVWGDGKMMTDDPETLAKERLLSFSRAETGRQLQSSDQSFGYPTESGTSGMNTASISTNYQVSSGDLSGSEGAGKIISVLTVLAFVLSVIAMI